MDSNPGIIRVSIRDLAKQAGVSHATVSMALRDNPRVAAETRTRIRKLAEDLGYRPDPMLSALANYRSRKSKPGIHSAAAWINAWPEPEMLRAHHEFDSYWAGAGLAAVSLGYHLEEFRLDAGCSPQRLHHILQARGIRGILLPPHRVQPDWDGFPWEEYSIVRFGRSLAEPRCHLVTADQVSNTLLAFTKMREMGYRRIGLATNESMIEKSGHYFEGGYLLARSMVPKWERVPILPTGELRGKALSALLSEWIRKHRVSAILTDVPALPRALQEAGIRVPDDVGLATTTVLDTRIAAGIHQEPVEIGRVAMLMLNSIINEGERGEPRIFRQILVEGRWVDGDSLPARRGSAG